MEIVIELNQSEEKAIRHIFEHEKRFLGEKSNTVEEYVQSLLKTIIRNKFVVLQQDQISSRSLDDLIKVLE